MTSGVMNYCGEYIVRYGSDLFFKIKGEMTLRHIQRIAIEEWGMTPAQADNLGPERAVYLLGVKTGQIQEPAAGQLDCPKCRSLEVNSVTLPDEQGMSNYLCDDCGEVFISEATDEKEG